MIQNYILIVDISITPTIRFRLPPGTNRLLLGTNLMQLNLVIKQQIKQRYDWIWAKSLLCNIIGRITLWNIILSLCLILPKSLTCLFIAGIYKYHWWDSIYRKWNKRFTGHHYYHSYSYCIEQRRLWERASHLSLLLLLFLLRWRTTLMRVCVTHLTLKFCVAIMTILLHTVMQISSICLGTTLHIELNGLKMNQLFGISRLIVGSINDAINDVVRLAIVEIWDLCFDLEFVKFTCWCCDINDELGYTIFHIIQVFLQGLVD